MMTCRYCSQELGDEAQVCTRCGLPASGGAMAAAMTGGSMAFGRVDPMSRASRSDGPRQLPPIGQSGRKAETGSDGRGKSRGLSRHQPSTYVLWVLLFLIAALLAYVLYTVAIGKPADLGVRYTESDYQMALAKTGISVRFLDMTDEEAAAFQETHRNSKLMLADYVITYAGYTPRSFEMTPREATAFMNEFLPMFSPFRDVQLAVPANGRLSASFRIHIDKLRLELLPDLIGETQPAFLARLLPRYLNVSIDGPAFLVQNSQLIQREQLDEIKLGAVSLRPFIGNTDRDLRDLYTSYAERIYRGAPRLRIQSLRVNGRRNFEFNGTLPLRITVRKR